MTSKEMQISVSWQWLPEVGRRKKCIGFSNVQLAERSVDLQSRLAEDNGKYSWVTAVSRRTACPQETLPLHVFGNRHDLSGQRLVYRALSSECHHLRVIRNVSGNRSIKVKITKPQLFSTENHNYDPWCLSVTSQGTSHNHRCFHGY